MRWEIILDYPDGLNVITRVLARGRQEAQNQRCEDRSRRWSHVLCRWRKEPEPRSTDTFQALEKARKQISFSPEVPGRNGALWTPSF